MGKKNFYEKPTIQSLVKTTIVSKYFGVWAKVVIPTAKNRNCTIAYIDLFAGPGRYDDGTKSTPLLILEKAIDNPDMQKMLVTHFNDKDKKNSESLKKAIKELPGIEKLQYPPQVHCQEVGIDIVKMFEASNLVPMLLFVDPWGYKGLTLRLIQSVLKNWGCDVIIFFNYNRINMGLRNSLVIKRMNALFGEEHATILREDLGPLNKYEKELLIIETLSEALKDLGGEYVLPFRFLNKQGNRTSHHLIFVSKSFKGYEIMKGIMAKESSSKEQGVPKFEYNVVDKIYQLLFELARPLDDLEEMLIADYAGQTTTVDGIYKSHSVGRRYIQKNYKEVLMKMEASGKIRANPAADKRRKNTMADTVKITFRNRGS